MQARSVTAASTAATQRNAKRARKKRSRRTKTERAAAPTPTQTEPRKQDRRRRGDCITTATRRSTAPARLRAARTANDVTQTPKTLNTTTGCRRQNGPAQITPTVTIEHPHGTPRPQTVHPTAISTGLQEVNTVNPMETHEGPPLPSYTDTTINPISTAED